VYESQRTGTVGMILEFICLTFCICVQFSFGLYVGVELPCPRELYSYSFTRTLSLLELIWFRSALLCLTFA
jgi:hypothetical protein